MSKKFILTLFFKKTPKFLAGNLKKLQKMSDAILSVGFACKLRLHTYVTRAGMLCG
jgi:hypothetical protein